MTISATLFNSNSSWSISLAGIMLVGSFIITWSLRYFQTSIMVCIVPLKKSLSPMLILCRFWATSLVYATISNTVDAVDIFYRYSCHRMSIFTKVQLTMLFRKLFNEFRSTFYFLTTLGYNFLLLFSRTSSQTLVRTSWPFFSLIMKLVTSLSFSMMAGLKMQLMGLSCRQLKQNNTHSFNLSLLSSACLMKSKWTLLRIYLGRFFALLFSMPSSMQLYIRLWEIYFFYLSMMSTDALKNSYRKSPCSSSMNFFIPIRVLERDV